MAISKNVYISCCLIVAILDRENKFKIIFSLFMDPVGANMPV